MNDKQIAKYCDDVRDTAIKQHYKIQNQRKEISMLHKKCALQQAEIELMRKDLIMDKISVKKIKAEAIKEFAERLKEKSKQGKGYLGNVYHSVDVAEIDNLVKEMAGAESG